jgi:hypothetical protein
VAGTKKYLFDHQITIGKKSYLESRDKPGMVVHAYATSEAEPAWAV